MKRLRVAVAVGVGAIVLVVVLSQLATAGRPSSGRLSGYHVVWATADLPTGVVTVGLVCESGERAVNGGIDSGHYHADSPDVDLFDSFPDPPDSPGWRVVVENPGPATNLRTWVACAVIQ
jgi:hypothetical protein